MSKKKSPKTAQARLDEMLPLSKVLPATIAVVMDALTGGDEKLRAVAEEFWRDYGPWIKEELKREHLLN